MSFLVMAVAFLHGLALLENPCKASLCMVLFESKSFLFDLTAEVYFSFSFYFAGSVITIDKVLLLVYVYTYHI